MSYIGMWKFHSIGIINDADEMVYLNGEEYLSSPMPYIDETEEEAVADEMKERKQCIGTQIKVCEDGNMYMLMPLPEGVSDAEVKQAVETGVIKLMDGMMVGDSHSWEDRDGEFWYDTGIEGEIFGEKADSWANASTQDGFISIMTMRFVKE